MVQPNFRLGVFSGFIGCCFNFPNCVWIIYFSCNDCKGRVCSAKAVSRWYSTPLSCPVSIQLIWFQHSLEIIQIVLLLVITIFILYFIILDQVPLCRRKPYVQVEAASKNYTLDIILKITHLTKVSELEVPPNQSKIYFLWKKWLGSFYISRPWKELGFICCHKWWKCWGVVIVVSVNRSSPRGVFKFISSTSIWQFTELVGVGITGFFGELS